MIFSTIKIRLACKIWVLYLQIQASYVIFSFVKVRWNLDLTKFWNDILLKYWDSGWLSACAPYAIWQHEVRNDSFLDIVRGPQRPPLMGATESDTPQEVGLNNLATLIEHNLIKLKTHLETPLKQSWNFETVLKHFSHEIFLICFKLPSKWPHNGSMSEHRPN